MIKYIRILFVFLFLLLNVNIHAVEEVSSSVADSILLDTTVSVIPEMFIVEEKHDTTADSSIAKQKEPEQSIKKDYFKPDPKKATWYAIVCPGLGQIYNRSYWKLPILYGGILTFTYLIRWNGGMYNDYHNAYHDILDEDPTTDSYLSLVPEYDGSQTWLQSTLKSKTTRYRRARDLSTFGLVAFYLVSVVDAFVDAHLYDFSVTDDLSMKVEPVFNTSGFGSSMEARQTSIVGVQCSFQFK
ncbi:MAG: DUF5683 domain-containing protein [Paludibacteraceae bacterium]|nr:DUF5683 domain-containing protein [Paludibacteraceae bacterium]